MTETVTVYCDNPHCHYVEYVILESEQCGEGAEHDFSCKSCGWITRYEIVYNIDVNNLEANPPQEADNE